MYDGKCSLILSGGPNSVRNRTKEFQKVFDDVANFMIFIGYPRSGHTLIGSLLDAHPHVVIANEFDVIGEWQDWKLKNRNKYYLFSQLYKNSQKEAQDGYRSSWANHRFDYSVPNQWQGKFQGSIKVCRGVNSHSEIIFLLKHGQSNEPYHEESVSKVEPSCKKSKPKCQASRRRSEEVKKGVQSMLVKFFARKAAWLKLRQ